MGADSVQHYMSQPVETVSDLAPLSEVIRRIKARHIHHLCVVGGGALLGVISDRDVMRALPSPVGSGGQAEFDAMIEAVTAGKVMTRTPLTTVPGASLATALEAMLLHNVSALPVLNGPDLVGILTDTDCLQELLAREKARRAAA